MLAFGCNCTRACECVGGYMRVCAVMHGCDRMSNVCARCTYVRACVCVRVRVYFFALMFLVHKLQEHAVLVHVPDKPSLSSLPPFSLPVSV